jgi:hypothetical protein
MLPYLIFPYLTWYFHLLLLMWSQLKYFHLEGYEYQLINIIFCLIKGICYVTHPSYIPEACREWEKRTNNAIVDYIVVPQLPRGALLEWHIWAHRHNNRFECKYKRNIFRSKHNPWYIYFNKLTAWNGVLDKFIISWLVKKFPPFYGTWRLITRANQLNMICFAKSGLTEDLYNNA